MDLKTLFITLVGAVGGGAVVVAGILSFGSRVMETWFGKRIDSAYDKVLADYNDKITRKSKAFEYLLEKELGYYHSLQTHIADIVAIISTINTQLQKDSFVSSDVDSTLDALEKINMVREVLGNSDIVYRVYSDTTVNDKIDMLIDSLRAYIDEAFHCAKEKYNNGIPKAINTQKITDLSQKCVTSLGLLTSTIYSVINRLSSDK